MSEQTSSVRISNKLKDFLDDNSVARKQTYEDVIWMLIGTNTLSKEQKNKAKSKYEENL